jgi:predicted DNA-binding protein (MmcQ/YjbR family)
MINVEEIRNHCVSKKSVEESFPFDEVTLVFKVGGKIFLLLSLESSPVEFNVKCDPVKAVELREKYNFILPGFHMNKKHWNTIVCTSQANRKLIFNCIDDSYDLVVASLPLARRKALKI